MRRKIFLMLTVILIALTSVRLAWIYLQKTPEHPPITQGVLDLRGWDFDHHRAISLRGEWMFYPGRLLDPASEDLAALSPEASFVSVPGQWNKRKPDRDNRGYGTYRLRILVDPDEERRLAIRPMEIVNSSEIYVNGRLVGHAGTPAASKSAYTAYKRVYTAFFNADRSEIDLVIRAANFHSVRKGGIVGPVLFGSAEAVNRFAEFSSNMQLLLCSVLLIHAVYALLLYFIGRGSGCCCYSRCLTSSPS